MTSTLYPLRTFVEDKRAAPIFNRYDQAAYFIGLHRAELVKAGVLIPGTGGRPSPGLARIHERCGKNSQAQCARESVTPWPPWCRPGRRVWFYQSQTYIGAVANEPGLVLEQRRRGLHPVRRRLTTQEALRAIELRNYGPRSCAWLTNNHRRIYAILST